MDEGKTSKSSLGQTAKERKSAFKPIGAESARLFECRESVVPWKKWGPYLSERQWGTVREDYSENGAAWEYFPHDHARSRAYRWGEDGLAGVCDDHGILCFALALWNGNDPILKERLFGLTNNEGNHGEDVKEYYFYLDSTPTHSYMKYLYKYPQRAYPYEDLVTTNQHRSRDELEYELLDTCVFDDNRYFDVFVEYAKAAPEDLLIRICVCNRGPDPALIHVLPTLWYRNTWSWHDGGPKPIVEAIDADGRAILRAQHTDPALKESVAQHYLHCEGTPQLLFTENETNNVRIFRRSDGQPYAKDGIDEYVVHGRRNAVNPDRIGTKAAAHYHLTIPGGQNSVIRLRLTTIPPTELADAFGNFDGVVQARISEADHFYDAVISPVVRADPDRYNVVRQALAGMLWGKQHYYLDANQWLDEHRAHPLRGASAQARQEVSGPIYLKLNADSGTFAVYLGPSWFLESNGVKFAKGDQIEVTGSKLQDKDMIIAREVKRGDQVLVLRNAQGIPDWSGGH